MYDVISVITDYTSHGNIKSRFYALYKYELYYISLYSQTSRTTKSHGIEKIVSNK